MGNYLRRRGVRGDEVVGVWMGRGIETVIGVLGILKSGGAYLPIDVETPVERARYMLRDAGSKVVLVEERSEGLVEGMEEINVKREREEIRKESEESPEVEVEEENLAYVIYTSGSTGKPKGVMIEHRSAVNLIRGLNESIYEGEEARVRVGINAPLVFDASVKQL